MDNHLEGMAGEYAVASEICRRGYLAQITYGNQKKMDILVISDKESSFFVTVEVKSTADKGSWPWIRGIPDDKSHILVFVNFSAQDLNKRPDFYILNGKDWHSIIEPLQGEKYEELDSDGYTPLWHEQKNPEKLHKGIEIKKGLVEEYQDDWQKLDVLFEKPL